MIHKDTVFHIRELESRISIEFEGWTELNDFAGRFCYTMFYKISDKAFVVYREFGVNYGYGEGLESLVDMMFTQDHAPTVDECKAALIDYSNKECTKEGI